MAPALRAIIFSLFEICLQTASNPAKPIKNIYQYLDQYTEDTGNGKIGKVKIKIKYKCKKLNINMKGRQLDL